MPNVSAVVSTTRGTPSLPGTLLRRKPLIPTTSSSGKPNSLCTPGVLAEGGPLGREEERACRRRAEGASLRGSSGALSERSTASTIDDMVKGEMLYVVERVKELWDGMVVRGTRRLRKHEGTRFNLAARNSKLYF